MSNIIRTGIRKIANLPERTSRDDVINMVRNGTIQKCIVSTISGILDDEGIYYDVVEEYIEDSSKNSQTYGIVSIILDTDYYNSYLHIYGSGNTIEGTEPTDIRICMTGAGTTQLLNSTFDPLEDESKKVCVAPLCDHSMDIFDPTSMWRFDSPAIQYRFLKCGYDYSWTLSFKIVEYDSDYTNVYDTNFDHMVGIFKEFANWGVFIGTAIFKLSPHADGIMIGNDNFCNSEYSNIYSYGMADRILNYSLTNGYKYRENFVGPYALSPEYKGRFLTESSQDRAMVLPLVAITHNDDTGEDLYRFKYNFDRLRAHIGIPYNKVVKIVEDNKYYFNIMDMHHIAFVFNEDPVEIIEEGKVEV